MGNMWEWEVPVCIICLKAINLSGKPPADHFTKQESLLNKFVLLSERLLNLPESAISNFRSLSVVSGTTKMHLICPACETVVGGVCQQYVDLCEVQLKFGWRMKQLQELIDSHNQLSSKLRSVLRSRVASQLELPGGPEQVRDIHRQISTYCRKAQGAQPSVSIPVTKISRGKVKWKKLIPGENCTIDLIKVEGDQQDQDRNDDEQHDLYLDISSRQEEYVDSLGLKRIKQNLIPRDLATNVTHGIPSEVVPKPVASNEKPKAAVNVAPAKDASSSRKRKRKSSRIDCCEELKPRFAPDGRDPSELTCRICTRKKPHISDSLKRLRTHLARSHENVWQRRNESKRPPLQCYFCHWSFAFEQSRQVHLELSPHALCLAKGKFSCSEDTCRTIQFTKFSDLNTHFENEHRGQPLFRCGLCSWPFLNPDMTQVHELAHIKIRWGLDGFKCPKCDERQFQTVNKLQNHYMSTHTTINSVLYKCPVCNLTCKYRENFEEHVRTHKIQSELKNGNADVGDYLNCVECGKPFPSQRLLNTHLRTHLKTQCSKCGKFVMKNLIAHHMRERHKEGQPHPCPKCGKLFVTRARVSRHVKQVHDPEVSRARRCHICQKEYQRTGLLNVHLRDVHQIEVEELKIPPKHICPECGKGYHNPGSLELHVDAKHAAEGERKWNFRCGMCLKTFWRPSLLKKHMAVVHAGSETLEHDLDS